MICQQDAIRDDKLLVAVFGLEAFGEGIEWFMHRHECIRVSYATDEAVVRDGLRIIAEEVKRASS